MAKVSEAVKEYSQQWSGNTCLFAFDEAVDGREREREDPNHSANIFLPFLFHFIFSPSASKLPMLEDAAMKKKQTIRTLF